jgi:phospholipid/cholesterol/gamma-HCH transport system ATP-binding protein
MDFAAQRVLDTLDITIPRGQTLVVIGESGCGKTVLLKLIIGLLRPSRGRITFDGQVLADLNDRDLARQRLRFGFLFQSAALFDSLSVFDNVAFGLREHRRRPEAQVRDIVHERLQEVGLSAGVERKMPAELSGGMRKRVGLARALALSPEVMLYDEPTTGLDPIMSDVINELILQTRRQHGVTSIVVTHDMKTAQKIADRVIMLYPLPRLKPGENQVLFDGSPADLEACPEPRVRQFVQGQARERLHELANHQPASNHGFHG